MSKTPFMPFQDFRKSLEDTGWVTPNTYCNFFAPIENKSGVYLFLMVRRWDLKEALVAYVGMSINLKQRLKSHEIMAQIESDDFWIMTWFKPTPASKLRKVEAGYITQFDPPWNIQGRTRGLVLQ